MVRAGWGSYSCAVQRILRIQLTLEGLAVVGRAVGCLLGEDDGALDGLAVGLFVGSTGLPVGCIEGSEDGCDVGQSETEGLSDGCLLGILEG